MSKFKLRELVKVVGGQDIHTVVEILITPGRETQYGVQFSTDSSTRKLVYESHLELAQAPQQVFDQVLKNPNPTRTSS